MVKEGGEGRCGRRCKDAEMQQCMSTVYEYECDGLCDQIDIATHMTLLLLVGEQASLLVFPFH